MTDIHSKEKRSYNMSRIRAKDTKPELMVRKFLFSKGYRYKLHDTTLPGKPDLVLPKYRTVIFVNGCFWHGHAGCKKAKLPNTRTEWWSEKINKNRANDVKVYDALIIAKWKVITIWQCDLKGDWQNQLISELPK
ncbi:very short patch repair endonuclease [Mucilaginibacter sp. UYCu711]|uniref:very short patch repair endonuclease n=1 Tax=Mucilaginibacter sp. UYCu711 TaxID=3156339 RepID=UPI003D1B7763